MSLGIVVTCLGVLWGLMLWMIFTLAPQLLELAVKMAAAVWHMQACSCALVWRDGLGSSSSNSGLSYVDIAG